MSPWIAVTAGEQLDQTGSTVPDLFGVFFKRPESPSNAPAREPVCSFAARPTEEQFKFGTLVFFSGLTHVGVVADEHGFYHASRRQGVIYSEFNEYWLKRIDGFRRVPLTMQVLTSHKNKKS